MRYNNDGYKGDSREGNKRNDGNYKGGGKRGGGRRGNFNSGGPREMHKATCSDCGQETEVPFKPTEGRPVYCRECFQNHRPPRRY